MPLPTNVQTAKAKMLASLAEPDVQAAKATLTAVTADASSTPEQKLTAQGAYAKLVRKALRDSGIA